MWREPAQEVSARRIGGVSERDQEEEQRRESVCIGTDHRHSGCRTHRTPG